MQTNWIVVCLTLLFLNIELSVGEPKRSFGFGRSRPKANSNLSVRRRQHSDPPKSPLTTAPKQTSHAAPAPAPAPLMEKNNGPPPAYSAGPSSGKTQLNAAPPAYSSHSAPPSYSSATGLNSHANYPRQGYSGVNSGMPGHGSPYNNYGGNSHYGGHNGGFAQPPPNYGGMQSGFGGYSGMPNYGGGMMGGGMMGGGMMGGVQPLYIQQQRSSGIGTSIAAGALAGLATYQLARALGGGSGYGHGHHSEQHIYHHYDNQPNAPASVNTAVQQTPQAPQAPQVPDAPQGPQQTLQTPYQMPQNTYGTAVQPVPEVPLAPFPSESTCTENCTPEPNVAVTPVPEIDQEFPFSTIHPSIFPYASFSQNKEMEYWAKSVNKKLNLTAPDTDNSSTSSP